MQRYTVYLSLETALHVWVVSPPIIRSTHLYNFITLVFSHIHVEYHLEMVQNAVQR